MDTRSDSRLSRSPSRLRSRRAKRLALLPSLTIDGILDSLASSRDRPSLLVISRPRQEGGGIFLHLRCAPPDNLLHGIAHLGQVLDRTEALIGEQSHLLARDEIRPVQGRALGERLDADDLLVLPLLPMSLIPVPGAGEVRDQILFVVRLYSLDRNIGVAGDARFESCDPLRHRALLLGRLQRIDHFDLDEPAGYAGTVSIG